MRLYHNEYELFCESEWLDDLADFVPEIGDSAFNELYKKLDREPNQYEYDNFIDDLYDYFVLKVKDL